MAQLPEPVAPVVQETPETEEQRVEVAPQSAATDQSTATQSSTQLQPPDADQSEVSSASALGSTALFGFTSDEASSSDTPEAPQQQGGDAPPANSSAPSTAAPTGAGGDTEEDDGWTCERCTFRNTRRGMRCEMCEAANPNPRPSSYLMRHLREAASRPEEKREDRPKRVAWLTPEAFGKVVDGLHREHALPPCDRNVTKLMAEYAKEFIHEDFVSFRFIDWDARRGAVREDSFRVLSFPHWYSLHHVMAELGAQALEALDKRGMLSEDDRQLRCLDVLRFWVQFKYLRPIWPIKLERRGKTLFHVQDEEVQKCEEGEDEDRWILVPDDMDEQFAPFKFGDLCSTKMDGVTLMVERKLLEGEANFERGKEEEEDDEDDEEKVEPYRWPRNATQVNPRSLRQLRIGDQVDARDEQQKWYEGIVRMRYGPDHDTYPNHLHVHFVGWKPRWDEYMSTEWHLDRFAAPNLHLDAPYRPRLKGKQLSFHETTHELVAKWKGPTSGEYRTGHSALERASHAAMQQVPQPSPEPELTLEQLMAMYAEQLAQLRDMGFPNDEANCYLLREARGNVQQVLNTLLS